MLKCELETGNSGWDFGLFNHQWPYVTLLMFLLSVSRRICPKSTVMLVNMTLRSQLKSVMLILLRTEEEIIGEWNHRGEAWGKVILLLIPMWWLKQRIYDNSLIKSRESEKYSRGREDESAKKSCKSWKRDTEHSCIARERLTKLDWNSVNGSPLWC